MVLRRRLPLLCKGFTLFSSGLVTQVAIPTKPTGAAKGEGIGVKLRWASRADGVEWCAEVNSKGYSGEEVRTTNVKPHGEEEVMK